MITVVSVSVSCGCYLTEIFLDFSIFGYLLIFYPLFELTLILYLSLYSALRV